MSSKNFDKVVKTSKWDESLTALFKAIDPNKKINDITVIPFEAKKQTSAFQSIEAISYYQEALRIRSGINLKHHELDVDQNAIARPASRLKTAIVREAPETKDLSNYLITPDGVVADTWDGGVLNIESRVIEIRSETVVLECIIDADKLEFQNRSFEKKFFAGIPIVEKYPILIKIFSRKNEIRYQFLNGKGLFDDSKFEIDHFGGIDLDFLNKKR